MRTVVVRILALVALAAAGLLGAALPAGAAPATLSVTPGTVSAGRTVTVSGTCETNTAGSVISPAFLHDATHDFAGVGAVSFQSGATGAFLTHPAIPRSTPPGTYVITARCGGGNLGIEAHLTVTAASVSTPTAVPAGSGGLATDGRGIPVPALLLGGCGAILLLTAGVGVLRRRAIR